MVNSVSEIDSTKISVNPESASMSGLIPYILNNSDDILANHSIHDTASKLDSFENFLTTFDKFDRRKGESADSKSKYSELRNDSRNNLVASLLDTMRKKIDFFEQEMNIVRDIQRNFVLQTMPQANGFEFQGYYQPSRQVGGDYYDLFSTNDDMMYFLISDVSGNGLPSSLVVASMQAYIYAGVKSRKPITILMQELNNYLTEKLTNEKYVTFFLGMLNLRDGYVQYVNAGHNPPYMIKSDGELVKLESGGPYTGDVQRRNL